MFKMEVDKVNKKLTVKIGGFFKEDEGVAFMAEYNKNVTSISTASSTLVLDCTDLLTSKQEMLPLLEGCIQLYKSSNFKKTIVVNPKSPSSKTQINKVGKKIYAEMVYVNTLEEANRLV